MTTVVVFCANLDRAVTFYQRLLDAPTPYRQSGFAHVTGGVDEVLLHGIAGDDEESGSDPAHLREDNPIKPVFTVDSIDAARARLVGSGGHLFDPARELRHGEWRFCDGADMDGNVIQVRERLA